MNTRVYHPDWDVVVVANTTIRYTRYSTDRGLQYIGRVNDTYISRERIYAFHYHQTTRLFRFEPAFTP